MTKLCHISNHIVQCVVFTPCFATLTPPLYIVRCNTMNFALSIVHLFALSLAHFRGWGFAFGAWVRDIENRDCLYKNSRPLNKYAYTKIQTFPTGQSIIIQKSKGWGFQKG
nr:MAG TPA: hypothetical protein [Caudoviricetes sp.]